MSERDCGQWYCQGPAGHAELEVGVDVILDHSHCGEVDVKCLDEQRAGVPAWMDMMRREGWREWLGAEQHFDGKAKHFWVWDVDSRGKYFEYRKFYNPGDVPENYGDLHKGRAWQLPMLGVFYYTPGTHELAPLKRNKIPYVIISEDVEPPPPPTDDCDEAKALALDIMRDALEDLEHVLR